MWLPVLVSSNGMNSSTTKCRMEESEFITEKSGALSRDECGQ